MANEVLYAFIKDNVVTNIAVFDGVKSAEWLNNWAAMSQVDSLVLAPEWLVLGAVYSNGEFTNPDIRGIDTSPKPGDPELRPDLAARTEPFLHEIE